MATWDRLNFETNALAIAKGDVNGCEVRNIFGYQEDVGNSFIPAWEYNTAYVYPTTGLNMSVTSDDTGDNGATVRVIGLDVDYNVISEDVVINTASPNSTTKQFFRINDVIFFDTNGNDGFIRVYNGSTNYGAIREGEGRNQASIYTVPVNSSYYLYRINSYSADASSPKAALFRNYTSQPDGRRFIVARTTFVGSLGFTRTYPFKYEEKTDIQLQVSTKSGTHEIAAFAEGVLIANDD